MGDSVTTGAKNVVVWSGVHHKTNTHGGSSHFGYPDETYFDRLKEELKSRGLGPADIKKPVPLTGSITIKSDKNSYPQTIDYGAEVDNDGNDGD